ncbi:MAG: acetyl-CoA C-acyltransferase family protein [Chloroflexaceae bacterium]|nr:acetyl-CoA C-acyltransferase family protein [Chloroflexaceae bacterium]
MASDREVVVVSAVRTAIGEYGGSLKDKSPTELAAACTREAISRAGIEPKQVQHSVFGNCIHTDHRDPYLGRVAMIEAGIPAETPAFTLNRLCGSGLQAIISASQVILLNEADCVVAGGAECMSRSPYWLQSLRWGARMNDTSALDAMVEVLKDPFHAYHMGITAENVAEKWEVSREDQDALAAESHRRASAAIHNGYFKDQILPIEIKVKRDTKLFDVDERVRHDVDIASMAKLRPAFKKDGGTVTAGNASGVNDAAAALILMERSAAERQGIKPMARLVAYAYGALDSQYMGMGPVPASQAILQKTGMNVSDFDVFEVNEAFASQALAVCREMGFPADKTNPNGSGISLGHPIGATAAILVVKAVYELHRIQGRYALVTMCIGGGQGLAAIFERI